MNLLCRFIPFTEVVSLKQMKFTEAHASCCLVYLRETLVFVLKPVQPVSGDGCGEWKEKEPTVKKCVGNEHLVLVLFICFVSSIFDAHISKSGHQTFRVLVVDVDWYFCNTIVLEFWVIFSSLSQEMKQYLWDRRRDKIICLIRLGETFRTNDLLCPGDPCIFKAWHDWNLWEMMGGGGRAREQGWEGHEREREHSVCVCVFKCVLASLDVRAASVHALKSRTSCGIVLAEARRMQSRGLSRLACRKTTEKKKPF